ncbi:NAD(P)/FAD-dependent oxidoreductase [Rhodovulum sp. DZ06]|uniref:NAD(P)/FAD-dependent oxidoreductase n=1 Tax=Rhodovulum sp. DZ06 TaxID=3425126 RepID=UPI003D3371A5
MTAASPADAAPTTAPNAADVIVIGGGIAGISAAAAMARERSVIVLEAERAPGTHSTGRSAAIFIRNYGNATLRALNAASAAALEDPEAGFGEGFDGAAGPGGALLSPRGELMIATEDQLPALEAYLDGSSGLERLTGPEAAALVPILRPDRIVAAALEADAQDIDVDRMLAGCLRLLRARAGADALRTGAPVAAMTRKGGTWRIEAGGETWEAPLVVNAAGAWAGRVAALAGAQEVGLTPLRRSAALLPAPGGRDMSRWPMFVSAAETFYAKPMGGKLMVSPADEDPVEPHDAWPDDMVLAEGLDRYEQAVTEPVTRLEASWAGLRTFAPDRTPVAGFDARAEGFLWLAGQGGYGVQTAPAMARIAAALIAGRAPAGLPPAVIAALDPKRFAG